MINELYWRRYAVVQLGNRLTKTKKQKKFPSSVNKELQIPGSWTAKKVKNKHSPSMMVSQNGHNLNCLQQKRIRHICSWGPPKCIELSNRTNPFVGAHGRQEHRGRAPELQCLPSHVIVVVHSDPCEWQVAKDLPELVEWHKVHYFAF